MGTGGCHCLVNLVTNSITQLEGQLHGENTAVLEDVESIVSCVSLMVGGVEVSRARLAMTMWPYPTRM